MSTLRYALLGLVCWAALIGYPGYVYICAQEKPETVYVLRRTTETPSARVTDYGAAIYSGFGTTSGSGGDVTLVGGSGGATSGNGGYLVLCGSGANAASVTLGPGASITVGGVSSR